MATSAIVLPKDTWTEIASSACRFQNKSDGNVFACERLSAPTSLAVPHMTIEPLEVYYYDAEGGTLYGYSPGRDSEIVLA